MRPMTTLAAVLLVLGSHAWSGNGSTFTIVRTAHADELPAVWQRKVSQLAKNIERSRQALITSGAEDVQDEFKKKQWLDRIENYRSSLARVPESSDQLLTDTRQALAALEAEFAGLQTGSHSEAASTEPAPSSNTRSAAPAAPAAPAAKPTTAPSSPRKAQLVSGQRVRVKKLARDIQNTTESIQTTGPSPMQSDEVVGKYERSLQQYADALGRYSEFGDDPDVRAASDAFAALSTAVKAEQQRARDQLQQLGDPQARLSALEASLRQVNPPGELLPPFTEQEAKAWVGGLAQAQQTAQSAGREIQAITPLAYLPDSRGTVQQGAPYDSQDLGRLQRSVNGLQSNVNAAVNNTQAMLKQRYDSQDLELNYFRNLDPDDDHARMNAYLAEGAEGDILARLDRQLALTESVAAYQRAFGKEPTAATTARIEEITGLREKYLADRAEVLGGYKLPEPVSDDAERIAVAKKILANPKYGFDQHGPIVLTTPEVVSREKEVSRDTIKDIDFSLSGTVTLSGTRETWNYKWEEFKFATPIKESDSDDWYVWWITAKKYESGWEKTPIGRWVSGGATKGSLILEKNFR